jgi:hypothetical protein
LQQRCGSSTADSRKQSFHIAHCPSIIGTDRQLRESPAEEFWGGMTSSPEIIPGQKSAWMTQNGLKPKVLRLTLSTGKR